jgi:sugar phosphate isomerase/epimerase
MMSRARFSTGTFKSDFSFLAKIEFLIEQGVRAIELSGGNYEENWLSTVTHFPEVDFSFHNYFPPPKLPFVFNLASADPQVREASIKLCKEAIRLTSRFGQKQFSFHSGFCFDPTPESLGSALESRSHIVDENSANEIFNRSLEEIASFAERLQVVPLVENNVLNTETAARWGRKSLLVTTADDIEDFFRLWGTRVGILLDVGHLRVSSSTVESDFHLELERSLHFASALHLHSNNGKEDQHLGISGAESWWESVESRRDIPWTFEVKPNEVRATLDSLGLQ